jgi:hypothetical protein
MKTIQPVPIWDNGQTITAVLLNANAEIDNLKNFASFYYCLLSDTQVKVTQGRLVMEGPDYYAYETNTYAYDWIAKQLNLTITGDYNPPTSTSIISPTPTPTVTPTL